MGSKDHVLFLECINSSKYILSLALTTEAVGNIRRLRAVRRSLTQLSDDGAVSSECRVRRHTALPFALVRESHVNLDAGYVYHRGALPAGRMADNGRVCVGQDEFYIVARFEPRTAQGMPLYLESYSIPYNVLDAVVGTDA